MAFGVVASGVSFYLDVGHICERLRRRRTQLDVKLQYTQMAAATAFERPGIPLMAQPIVSLENPNDVMIRVDVEHMRTTFDNSADDVLSPKYRALDMAPRSRRVEIQGQMIKLGRHMLGDVVRGRIDWRLKYGPVFEGTEPELTRHLDLLGTLEIHWIDGQFVTHWAPDLGTEVPAMIPERIEAAEGGEFWTRPE